MIISFLFDMSSARVGIFNATMKQNTQVRRNIIMDQGTGANQAYLKKGLWEILLYKLTFVGFMCLD